MKLGFTKMHGIGNDFIVVDARDNSVKNPNELAKKLCARRFSIGADGLILILNSDKADYRMRIFNPDGSEPEMCGNGIRCFAKYLYDKGITKKSPLTVETGAGVIKPERVGSQIKVDMGEPILEKNQIPFIGEPGEDVNDVLELSDGELTITTVSMGNPHAVVFVDDVKNYPVERVGKEVENHPSFPQRTNVEFIKVKNKGEIDFRVWERGAGETLACGTGACASVVACVLNGKTDKKVKVHLPGGDLLIEWGEKDDHVYMTGPAETVFEGTVEV